MSSITGEQWLELGIKNEDIKSFIYERFVFLDKLGEGGFGSVQRAIYKSGAEHKSFALKKLKSAGQNSKNESLVDEIIKELKFLRKADFNDRILRFYGVTKDPATQSYLLVLEFADGGSLREYLTRFPRLRGEDKLRLAREIASGLCCLHEEGILHRDLSSLNILVHQDHIKIADLGLGKRLDDEMNSFNQKGHLGYVEPQCFIKKNYVRDKRSDIYSLGVVFWEVSSARQPFGNTGLMIIPSIISGEREKRIPGTPDEYVDLYTECWDQNPDKRPDIHDVCDRLVTIKWPDKRDSDYQITGLNDPQGPLSSSSGTISSTDLGTSNENSTTSRDYDSNSENNDLKLFDELLAILKRGTDQAVADEYKTAMIERLKANDIKPLDAFEKLSKLKHGNDQPTHPLLLGHFYSEGIGTDKNEEEAFTAYKVSADNGDPYGQYYLGRMYQFFKKDMSAAFSSFQKAADGGCVCAQKVLADCFSDGDGCRENKHLAFYWYEKAADGKNPMAQFYVGECYETGYGVSEDIQQAISWYQKAANNGHHSAKVRLVQLRRQPTSTNTPHQSPVISPTRGDTTSANEQK